VRGPTVCQTWQSGTTFSRTVNASHARPPVVLHGLFVVRAVRRLPPPHTIMVRPLRHHLRHLLIRRHITALRAPAYMAKDADRLLWQYEVSAAVPRLCVNFPHP
jgi:hypothetical protein